MAGIHEITIASPKPQRRQQPAANPRAALRAHIAQFEQLVRKNRAHLEKLEVLLRAGNLKQQVVGLEMPT